MKRNDEMFQMFSQRGLAAAYLYLVIAVAGYTFYEAAHMHYQPFWMFVMGSQGAIWIIATQIFQWHKLGREGLSTGSWITLILASVLLVLMIVVYGVALLDWLLN